MESVCKPLLRVPRVLENQPWLSLVVSLFFCKLGTEIANTCHCFSNLKTWKRRTQGPKHRSRPPAPPIRRGRGTCPGRRPPEAAAFRRSDGAAARRRLDSQLDGRTGSKARSLWAQESRASDCENRFMALHRFIARIASWRIAWRLATFARNHRKAGMEAHGKNKRLQPSLCGMLHASKLTTRD